MEASEVYLLRTADNALVKADLFDEIADEHVVLWYETWVPEILKLVTKLSKDKVPLESWPEDVHWNWHSKVDYAKSLIGMRTFCIVCEKSLEGMIVVDLTKTCRLVSQQHKELAYVDYVSTAPWNRSEICGSAKFHGVGSILIRAAVELSIQEKFEGRIGLHSLPQAADFYRSKCCMTELGPDKKKENLVYFEMTPEQAQAFLKR